MIKALTIFALLSISLAAHAESCQIISVKGHQETVIETKPLGGRTNNGTISGGFSYDITSTPGPVDMIYITNAAGQVVQASGPIISSETPLTVSLTDSQGNGASIRCSP
jgi:hypothetical protein